MKIFFYLLLTKHLLFVGPAVIFFCFFLVFRWALVKILILKLPPLQNYFLSQSSPWCVINEFFHLEKKYCFVLEIFRFLCFCESTDFKISDDIIGIATQWKLHLCLSLLNPQCYQKKIWSKTSVLYDKHF